MLVTGAYAAPPAPVLPPIIGPAMLFMPIGCAVAAPRGLVPL